jgi:GT2 family glycosyltransferase
MFRVFGNCFLLPVLLKYLLVRKVHMTANLVIPLEKFQLIPNSIGIVVIGRNEGARLENCLSKLNRQLPIIYVDSGSTDDSVEFALGLSCKVIELDMSVPFTAARARNVGWRNMAVLWPEVRYIQFLDGDCELAADWLTQAVQFFDTQTQVAAVSGRLRERFPKQSIYNQLCDFEWDTPLGLTSACGGIALIRLEALKAVNGFNDSLIAGEEPEMCLRMRRKGWSIWRIDYEMALHDAAIHRIKQWWARSKRGGFGSASTAYLHRGGPESFNLHRVKSALFWGLALPIVILLLATQFGVVFLNLLFVYPAQIVRLGFQTCRQNTASFELCLKYAFFLVSGKFAEALGVVSFYFDQLTNRRQSLIEYK